MLNVAPEKFKPWSFDIDTSKEVVGDERVRLLEQKARIDAEKSEYLPPAARIFKTYWDECWHEFELSVYTHAYQKRLFRLARLSEHQQC